jgi:hypothetical protein
MGTGPIAFEFEVYEGTSAAGTPIITVQNTQYRMMVKGFTDTNPQATDRGGLVRGTT